MPDSQYSQLDEPGNRTGEGSKSILPHLHRQVQARIKPPAKRLTPDEPKLPGDVEAVPPEEGSANRS
jgi:hypothetical protein